MDPPAAITLRLHLLVSQVPPWGGGRIRARMEPRVLAGLPPGSEFGPWKEQKAFHSL